MLPDSLMCLAAKGQGHRVNGTADGDLAAMRAWLLETAPPGIHGMPRHPPLPTAPTRSAASAADISLTAGQYGLLDLA